MPGRRLTRAELRAAFRRALLRAQVREATGKLTKLWYENYYCSLAQSMIEGSRTVADLMMFKAELTRMEEERTVDYNFSDRFGTDYEYEFSPLDHFLGTMQLLVAELRDMRTSRQ